MDKRDKKSLRRSFAVFILAAVVAVGCMSSGMAWAADNGANGIGTGVTLKISAAGEYKNWDGVSNVDQFIDNKGNFCLAYDEGGYVYVVKTKKGVPEKKRIKLKKAHSLFGGIACDSDGNYYLATGEENKTNNTKKNTIFVSKYNAKGKLVKTVGDNGSSSLAYYYGEGFYTKIPFHAGSCDVAINGKTLVVHYAREMYSGHQSDSVFAVNTKTLKKVDIGTIYQSHSFAQRAIPYKGGFLFAGEGDCYNRAFTITAAGLPAGQNYAKDIFHFWVRKNALNDWDMFAVNDNFAHMGGLVMVDDTNAALAGTSVKALSSKATQQSEQLFIQIFDPSKDLATKEAYVTKGTRKGTAGPNGDEKVVDYGVKWLTNFDQNTRIAHPQVVSDGKGTVAVLFEKYEGAGYKGVYYIKVDKKGKIKKSATCLSADAMLNPCRMPVYTGGKVYWAANKYNDAGNQIYIFSAKL